jgi:arginyl-tRNA--protein-N-Asp/Glu arginylyltransferase
LIVIKRFLTFAFLLLPFAFPMHFINEEFYLSEASPAQMDAFWADGWRHFGTYFFRYSLGFYELEIRRVLPLRIRLADFSFSKSQRRVLRRNQDLRTIIRPIEITTEKEKLFELHRQRFRRDAPFSLYDFLSYDAARVPCKALEICVYRERELLAVSFFDVGARAISSIYAMFAPESASRSLGIFTLLLEIEWARENGKDFLYQGYAYEGNSFYDYKKRFRALEKFDWKGGWEDFTE